MRTISAPTSRLVLRDGSTAGVRPATSSDRHAMRRFFEELSPASRRLRFLSATTASEALLDRFCQDGEPQDTLTLIACREGEEGMHIIGVGSYFAESETTAEVAFVVDDRFHGRGIATALL
jgi:RimJ/RimL family protein N-acetyltransferase